MRFHWSKYWQKCYNSTLPREWPVTYPHRISSSTSEVRKVVALNIPPTDLTIDALVSRTRDVDDAVRRVIYHHCLPQIPLPRHFSIAQREQILRNGLGDRDETVKASAAKLIGQWVDLFDGNLLEYLDTFELVSGTEVAEDALKALFKHRPDVLDSIKFEGAYMLVGPVVGFSHEV